VRRRGLISGAMATALMAGLSPELSAQGPAGAGMTGPGAALSGSQRSNTGYMAAFRQRPLPDAFTDQTTQNSLNGRKTFVVPTGTGLTDLVVAFPAAYWVNTAAETDFPVPYTVTAAIEYPAGTFTPLFANGSRTLTVTPGRSFYRFDPCPIYIPAGATAWIKTFCQWTASHFPLQHWEGMAIFGDWTNVGTGLSDLTLSATVQSNTVLNAGFASFAVYAHLTNRVPVLGILGDSISAGYSTDFPDQLTGALFLEKALINTIPIMSFPRGSDSLQIYTNRHDCRDGFGRNPLTGEAAITDLYLSLCRNDLGVAPNLAALQALYLPILTSWQARGVRVRGMTVTPQSTSSDGWITTANQAANATNPLRVQWNNYLRTNWQALGLTALDDWAWAVDPTDSGMWGVDPNLAGIQQSAGCRVTLTNRAITGAASSTITGATFKGSTYPISSAIPCTVYPYYGDAGAGGGQLTANIDGTGAVANYTINAGGDYDYPPMVMLPGRWTSDGLHPTMRGCIEILRKIAFGPKTLTL
jgi:hypothetical protein